MPFTIDRFLGLFKEDFQYDRDQHVANLRILRAYLELPYDILPITTKTDLPTSADWPQGTIVVVKNAVTGHPEAWINKTDGWYKLRDTQNTAEVPAMSIVSGSFDPGSIGAHAGVNVAGTVTGVTTSDTVVLLSAGGSWTYIFFEDARITGTDQVTVLARNVNSSAFDPGATTLYFLLIKGLNGP